MTTKSTIHGAWTLVRINPWDGETFIIGVFPEDKAALLRLEHIMTNPVDNEEYKLEYHVFPTVEQELEKYQTCKQSRAEWDEKTRVYEEYKEAQKENTESNSPIAHE
jgi:hypothetical protein